MDLGTISAALVALLSKFSIKININYEKKEIKQIIRIEHDKFEICIPQKERIRVLGIVPKTRLIHRTTNDGWSIKGLWW
jgi:hypothetical protein